MGPSVWIQLIGLIPVEADINSAQRGLEMINVPDGHTCGPLERKYHARERASSCDLKSPLMHDLL